jgi:hypothetical protein
MKRAAGTRSLTVRLRPNVYEPGVRVARRRRITLNALLQESLARGIAADEDRQWREWFEALGNETDEDSVEYAEAAQAEVLLADE